METPNISPRQNALFKCILFCFVPRIIHSWHKYQNIDINTSDMHKLRYFHMKPNFLELVSLSKAAITLRI